MSVLQSTASATEEARATPLGGVAIFGPGLIGGSVAMALRARSPGTRISIWGRRPEQLAEILRRGIADSVETDPAAAVSGADIAVLCTPVGSMRELAAAMAPGLSPSAVVTDAGSVKACVVEQLEQILGSRFIGAHPMAGSERSGLAAARTDLFTGAPCLITPTPGSDAAALREMSELPKSMASALGDENSDSLLDFLARAKQHRDSLPLPPPEESP